MNVTGFVRGAVAALMLSAVLSAQQAPTAQTPNPDLSGIWTRVDTSGSQSYGGISASFPEAQLHPQYAAKLPPKEFNGLGTPPPGWQPPEYQINEQATIPRCAVGGGGRNAGNGGVNITSLGISIMVAKDLVMVLRDGAQGGRHIYTDGRAIPPATQRTELYSVGRWDGPSLVVTTRGFNPGQTGFGRGWIEPSTELTERFDLLPDGRMKLTYTWSDPEVYVKPHTYEMIFERLPANQALVESWCDSREWITANEQGTLRPPPVVP
jgi:hypothetical protein